jgi:nucleoside-diphosphate-sugar epimerase
MTNEAAMKILFTGADGYIGGMMGPMLLERGFDAVGVDTGFYRRGWLFEDGSTRPMVISRDVRHLSIDDVRGFDAVVHLAELSNDPLGENDPEVTVEVNHRASVAFACTCKAAGVPRFIYSSSCSIYGADGADVKTEDSQPDPQTTYARCKVLNEIRILTLMDARFTPVFLRNATAFGASPRQRFDLVLNNIAGWAFTSREIRMTSDGSPWRPIVHVQDICAAIICALEAPREAIAGHAFNVGDDTHNYRIRDIAEIVSAAFPGCRTTFGPNGGDNRSYRVSFAKIRSHMPGFRCQWTPAQGAAELRMVFERIGLDAAIFQAPPFTRLAELKHLQRTQQVDEHLFWTRTPRLPVEHRDRGRRLADPPSEVLTGCTEGIVHATTWGSRAVHSDLVTGCPVDPDRTARRRSRLLRTLVLRARVRASRPRDGLQTDKQLFERTQRHITRTALSSFTAFRGEGGALHQRRAL